MLHILIYVLRNYKYGIKHQYLYLYAKIDKLFLKWLTVLRLVLWSTSRVLSTFCKINFKKFNGILIKYNHN